MSRCVANALCYLVITRQPGEFTFANPLAAKAYTRCCGAFIF